MKKRLSEVRFKAGKTQLALMLESGVAMSRISQIENGKFIPSDKEKSAIAKALSVPVESVDWPTLAVSGELEGASS